MKELWDHAIAQRWAARSLYTHVAYLASTLVSTKESLEDLLGDLSSHVQNDVSNPFLVTPERLFFQATISERLDRTEHAYLCLKAGDFTNEFSRKHSRNRKHVFGGAAPHSSVAVAEMKILVMKGLTKCDWVQSVMTSSVCIYSLIYSLHTNNQASLLAPFHDHCT